MSLEEPAKDSSAQSSTATLARKRPASERKIQANRRNALYSTGPKTVRGKRTVARNAIKHGLLAREVVITAGDGKESSEEFDALVGQLWEYYEPVGVVEELLVKTIANGWWRKARVLRAENGEIRKRLDTLAMDRKLRNSDKGNRDLALSQLPSLLGAEILAGQLVLTKDGISDAREARRDFHKNLLGLESMTGLLQIAKSEIARDGYISRNIRHRIYHAFLGWDYTFALACLASSPPEAKKADRPSEKVADEQSVNEQTDKEHAALIAAAIDSRLKKISELKRNVTKREDLARDAEARSFSLPPADATDKLLRYEAHLDRQLYRAMDQLERLQRRRQEKTCRLLSTSIWGEGDNFLPNKAKKPFSFN
jgi:hypothetical protein